MLYCEKRTVRNVLGNERSNIGINPTTMDAKIPVVYHAPVSLAVWLQRLTSTWWPQYSIRIVICLCDNSRRFFIFQKWSFIRFWKTSCRCDACVRYGCRTSLPVTNISSIWMLAIKTSDSMLRIRIFYRKWSRWMKVGCITTTHSPNCRVNTGSARTSGICRKWGSRNLHARCNWLPFSTTKGSFINIFAPQKQKLIWTIIWKSCRFCVQTLLANDPTFRTPRSCTTITCIRILQGRLWSTSNRMVTDSCVTRHTAWT